ncbi:MAG: AAA family ATPase [Ideonella sp.]|nr:AAA family ATPase [Ideonella sp.]MCC7455958.1 AAA family ATPase [Nitrospira sp.]
MSAVLVPAFDRANPPEGRRIELSVIASELGLGVRALADATGLSRSAVSRIMVENIWPAREDRVELQARFRAVCAEHGASEADLELLFHAHVRKRQFGNPTGKTRIVPRPAPPRQQEITDVLLAKQTLSPEARRKWSLPVNPFDGEVESAEQMFASGEIRFVREVCWQAAVNARFVAVVGESGAGKTTLLADLKERIAAERKQVLVVEPSVLGMEDTESKGMPLKSGDILHAIVATLDPLAKVGQTMERRTRQAEKLLAGSMGAGNSHLVLIEEAHSLPIATLKHLKRLHERMRLNGRKPMLGILLLGQPELKAKLDDKRHDVREVVQRIELVELQPLGNDLKPYLQHRARLAGRELAELIDDSGVEAIRERLTVVPPGLRNAQPMSLLYPLAVNNMMTAVLNKTAQLGPPVANRDVVRLVM